MVSVNPPDAVLFSKNNSEGKGISTLELSNSSGIPVLFKVRSDTCENNRTQVKTTQPKAYIVRPNQGVMPAGSTQWIEITSSIAVPEVSSPDSYHKQGDRLENQDKFLV